MSLSPFDSFQSQFVTYLLNSPRTLAWWWLFTAETCRFKFLLIIYCHIFWLILLCF